MLAVQWCQLLDAVSNQMKAIIMAKRPVPDYADLMTVEKFKNACEDGMLIDYDGCGEPVVDGMVDDDITIIPSKLEEIPEWATHIAWYNR
jgi:hypothetical protein